MGVGRKRAIRAVTLDLDDTLWPCEPTLVRAERLSREWLTERAPEVIASCSNEQLRERRMAIHAARPELKHDFVTIRRLALQELFRAAEFLSLEQLKCLMIFKVKILIRMSASK